MTSDWSAPVSGAYSVMGVPSRRPGHPSTGAARSAVRRRCCAGGVSQPYAMGAAADSSGTRQPGYPIRARRSATGRLRAASRLSGYRRAVELRRRILPTLAETLLPLGLMALIMYASLHFPTALVKEKSPSRSPALCPPVLLASINSQLGNVGYVIAIEYGFYAFFALCLLCIVAVLMAERLPLPESSRPLLWSSARGDACSRRAWRRSSRLDGSRTSSGSARARQTEART